MNYSRRTPLCPLRLHLMTNDIRIKKLLLCCLASLSFISVLSAQAPDLTSGGVPSDTLIFNLGPTGGTGWWYRSNGNTAESRQILVTVVDAGSPADGILEVDDVILGADGTGASPVAFSSDARKSLGKAIADAEARNMAGNLKLLLWRAGTTSEVSVSLPFLGAYSATAPYNCPKSAAIFELGLDYVMKNLSTESDADAGTFSFRSLALLAANGLQYDGGTGGGGDAARQAQAASEVRSLILDEAKIAEYKSGAVSGESKISWSAGHQLIVLSEYYLQTGDATVLPSIEAWAVLIANGASVFGTMGHQLAQPATVPWSDGSTNGSYTVGYGVVNSAAVPCYLGLSIAKKCNLTGLTAAQSAKVDATLENMSRYYGYHEGWGSIMYGENAPFSFYADNGKSGAAALGLALDSDRASESKYFAKSAAISFNARESGHTGSYFNMLWSPLGAAVGGEEIASAYFNQISWQLDLSRRWNGGFDYDPPGASGGNGSREWNGFSMSTVALLTYAMPLRQLEITGKSTSHNLDASDIIFAGKYAEVVRSDTEVVADLDFWAPVVRRWAAAEIGHRTHLHDGLLPTLHATATDGAATMDSRLGAIMALENIKDDSSAATLAPLLFDPSAKIRFFAAEALGQLSQSAKMSQLNMILSAADTMAAPLKPMSDDDPLQWAHSRLATLLFGPGGILQVNGLDGVDRPLLYAAIEALAATPVGIARIHLAMIYPQLDAADMDALAETMVDVMVTRAPANSTNREKTNAITALQLHNISEGVPLAVYAWENFGDPLVLNKIANYGASYLDVVPEVDITVFWQGLLGSNFHVEAQAGLDAIFADINPAALHPFKSINSIITDAATVELPANSTNLHCAASDLANGDLIYTWRKAHGAGNVTFTPNGTAAAANTAIVFTDNISGQYLFEVTVSDSLGLTEVSETIGVTLEKAGGGLDPNSPPSADDQSLATGPYSPVSITLTGTDPEALPLVYNVISGPLHGTLSGSAPNLTYLPDSTFFPGTDSLTFEVMDSEGQTDTAIVTIDVQDETETAIVTHVFEPFDYTINDPLTGQNGGTGFSGAWADGDDFPGTAAVYDATSMPVDTGNGTLDWDGVVDHLPAQTGGFMGQMEQGGHDKWEMYRPLTQSAGAMAGADNVLWASFVLHHPNGEHVAFALATDVLDDRGKKLHTSGSFGSGDGNGIGVSGRVGSNGGALNPTVWNGGVSVANTNNENLKHRDYLVVLKYEFGATDTVSAYAFAETEWLSEANFDAKATSTSASVDESTLNILTISKTRVGAYDEIRVSDSFASVMNAEGFGPFDVATPAPDAMTFEVAPMAVSETSITMTATTASDPSGVEYYFTCTSGNAADSGWQDSPLYLLNGLTADTEYTFTVEARDKSNNRNTTVASAPMSLTTFAAVPDNALVYESFNYSNGPLEGRNGGTGFASGWNPSERGDAYVWNEFADFTDGSETLQWDGVINNPNIQSIPRIGAQYAAGSTAGKTYFYRTLASDAGTLAGGDGVLWMTTVVHADTSIAIGLSNSYLSWGMSLANGPDSEFIGVGPKAGTTLQPHVIIDNGTSENVGPGAILPPAGEDYIIVMKFTFSGWDDTVETYAFSENDVLSEATFDANKVSATLNGIDESTLNILTIALDSLSNAIDEIRIADSFVDVIGQDVATPTLASTDIVDDRNGTSAQPGTLVNYTVTFRYEDISSATVTAGDFGNAGTSIVNIGAVTEIEPGVFTVEATPTNNGTLQLQVNAGAIIEDLAGNALDTTSAIIDDTIIYLNTSPSWNENPVTEVEAEADLDYAGTAATLADNAADPTSDPLAFAKVDGPAWLSVAANGTLAGTPGVGDVGINTFTVSVADAYTTPIEATLKIGVVPAGNQAPTVSAGLPDGVTIDYSAWTPASVSPLAWYDASDAASIVNNGSLVSQWNDKSGNAHHMLQGTSGNQPTTGSRQINGLNAIDFDGSNDQMQQAVNAFGSSISNVSLFMVMQSDVMDLVSDSSILDLDGNSQMAFYDLSSYCFEVNNQRNFDGWCEWGDSSGDTGKVVQNTILYGGPQDLFQAWQNGILKRAHGSYDANPIQATSAGMRLAAGQGSVYDGLFAEVVVFDGVLDDATRQKIEGYLAHKWGTVTSLPTNHPYRWEAPVVGGVANLDGTANDPDSDPLTTTWSVASGPGEVVFGDTVAVDTTAEFRKAGSYDLQLSVTDSYYQESDLVTVTVDGPIVLSYDQNSAVVGTLPSGPVVHNLNDNVTVLGNAGGLDNEVDGMIFNGWNTAADGSGTAHVADDTFTIAASTTLYAQWLVVPTYDITYNGNGNVAGTVPATQVKTQTKDLTLATNSGALVKNSYHFVGWNMAPDGSGTDYVAGGTFSTDAAITLYAKWGPATYAIDFGGVRVQPEFVGMTSTSKDLALFEDSMFVNYWSQNASGTAGGGSGSYTQDNTGLSSDLTIDGNQINTAGYATGVTFGNGTNIFLPAGDWQVEVWAYDQNNSLNLDVGIVTGVSNGDSGAELQWTGTRVVQAAGVIENATDPVATFTFTADGSSVYGIYSAGTAAGGDRSRISGVRLTQVFGNDVTLPTLAASDIVDDQGGADVNDNTLVTYTVSFSEDMDEATVDASVFSNAGSSSVTIGTVTETSLGVFTVEVTPTSGGSLQLQLSAGAMLTDVEGNTLNTSSAIADDTTIMVNELNVAPDWTSNVVIEVDATEDAAYSSTLADDANDANSGAILTFAKVSGPAWLTVAVDGSLGGTPSNADVGSVPFTVSVTDGIIATPVETPLVITVINTNDAPVASDDSVSINEDSAVAITLTASDVDGGDTLTYPVLVGPSNGALGGTAPNLIYIPNGDYSGSDSFTFKANDGTVDSNIATFSFTVNAINDAPVFTADPINGSDATEDAAYTGTIAGSATDVDAGDSLTYALVSPTTWLSVAGDGTLSGTPTNDNVGGNSFTVSVSDGTAAVNATLNITVINTNDAPVANDDSATTAEDVSVAITLPVSDVDVGDMLTYAVLAGPTNGVLSGTAPNLTYTPNSDYSGTDSFTFKANDGTVDSNTATVSITVNANDAPFALNDSVSTDEDTAVAVTLVATDADGDPLTYAVVSGPTNGVLSGTAPNLTYAPNGDYNGSDSFTFVANDGKVDSNTATVAITINSISDAPVVNAGLDQTIPLPEDWTPELVSPLAWYDASDAGSIVHIDSLVSQWNDKSGNGNHATQPSSVSQPAYDSTSNSITGGSAKKMSLPTDMYLGKTSGSLCFVGEQVGSGAGWGKVGSSGLITHSPWTNGRLYDCFLTGGRLSSVATSGLLGTQTLQSRVHTGTTMEMYSDGEKVLDNSSTFNASTATAEIFGQYANYTLYEVVFLPDADVGTRQKVEGYLAHKWGTTLPAGHPYEYAPPGGFVTLADASVTDADIDDNPTVSWTVVRKVPSAAADPSFDDATLVNATATFTEAGTYTLRLTADDGFDEVFDEIQITVSEPISHTLTYDGNESDDGSAPTDANSPYEDGALVTVLGNTGNLLRADFTFDGWNTAADGNGTTYAPDDTFTIDADTTLYAQWVANVVGFTLSKSASTLDENGGTDIFTVVLDSQPASDVVFDVTSSDTGEATVSPISLTFTSANWDTPQTATITGVDDDTVGDDSATITASVNAASSDDAYDGLVDQTVSVTCSSNDLTLSVAAGTGAELVTGAGVKDQDAAPYAITAIASDGYSFVNWTVTAGSATFADANNPFTDVTAAADATVLANFSNVLTPFENWAGEGSTPVVDSNNDGIADGLAWVLGADGPSSDATELLPTSDIVSQTDYFIYTYRRSDAALDDANFTIEVIYGSDLTSWTTAVDDGGNVVITETDDGYATGVDRVEVKLHWNLASEDKMFTRLKVTIDP